MRDPHDEINLQNEYVIRTLDKSWKKNMKIHVHDKYGRRTSCKSPMKKAEYQNTRTQKFSRIMHVHCILCYVCINIICEQDTLKIESTLSLAVKLILGPPILYSIMFHPGYCRSEYAADGKTRRHQRPRSKAWAQRAHRHGAELRRCRRTLLRWTRLVTRWNLHLFYDQALQSHSVWPTGASCFWRRQFWGNSRRIILKIQCEHLRPTYAICTWKCKNEGIHVCTRSMFWCACKHICICQVQHDGWHAKLLLAGPEYLFKTIQHNSISHNCE